MHITFEQISNKSTFNFKKKFAMDKILPQITRGDTRFVIHVSEKPALEDLYTNINYDDPHLNLMQEDEFKVMKICLCCFTT